MAIQLNFDTAHQVIMPKFILTHRNGEKINIINNIDETSVKIVDSLNQPTEVNFTVYQIDNNEQQCIVWDYLQDFKLVYCIDWNEFFDVSVTVDETEKGLSKNVSLKHLPESELSRINVYNLEINSEAYTDVNYDDEKITHIYDPANEELSLLHRLFENAPHYIIEGCDISLQDLVRVFSWDAKDIKSCLDELCEEIQAIVEYKAYINNQGEMIRSVYLKDLLSSCNNSNCDYYLEKNEQYRGEFIDECPKCGSHNITEGYGEDTNIFITEDCLGNDIHYENNVATTKNCFRLIAGDDLMTETVANCNPNGGKYLWCWSDKFLNDMSEELRDILTSTTDTDSYKYKYQKYMNEYILEFSDITPLPSNTDYHSYLPRNFYLDYNAIVDKYNVYREVDEKFLKFPNNYQIVKYSNLTKYIYDSIDLGWYLKSSLMPTWSMSDTTAEDEADKLEEQLNGKTVALPQGTNITGSSSNSAVLSLAKLIVDNRYKVAINNSSLSNATWTGNFNIVNYSDSSDNFLSQNISITINNNYETYVKQTLKQELDKFAQKNDKYNINGLFALEDSNNNPNSDFKNELKKYSFDSLSIFADCCQGCINVLIEKGMSSSEANSLYQEYLTKYTSISNEKSVRENELNIVLGKYFDKNDYDLSDDDIIRIDFDLNELKSNFNITYGIQRYLSDTQEDIKAELNLRNILGERLYKEFICYQCEDVYKNDKFTSEGLYNNADLFRNAEDFLERANEDIYKSANSQHKITAKLNNLLIIPEFEGLVNSFSIGNWLRIRINDNIYRLRLLNYEFNFNNLSELNVDFAEITETFGGFTDIKKVLDKASSMSSSYNSVKRQAKKGQESKEQIDDWFQNGLDLTNTQLISDSNHQDQVWNEQGMLFRRFIPELNDYDQEQFKIINNTIALTDDNWQSTKVAVGKFIYQDPSDNNTNKFGYGINAETIVGKLILGQELGIYNSSGSLKFNQNGLSVDGSNNSVLINPNNSSIITVKKGNNNLLSFDNNGDLIINGEINANKGSIGGWTIGSWRPYSGNSHSGIRRTFDKGNNNYVTVALDSYSDNGVLPEVFQIYNSNQDGDNQSSRYILNINTEGHIGARKITLGNDRDVVIDDDGILCNTVQCSKIELFDNNLVVSNDNWSSFDYSYNGQSTDFEDYKVNGAVTTPLMKRKRLDVVELNGACTLKDGKSYTGSDSVKKTIGTLPDGWRPDQKVVTLCQGSGKNIWLCEIDEKGVVNMSRYRNESGYQTATSTSTSSVWLPIHVSFYTQVPNQNNQN